MPTSNGQTIRYISNLRPAPPIPATDGSGTRVLFMPPEIITARAPEEQIEDDSIIELDEPLTAPDDVAANTSKESTSSSASTTRAEASELATQPAPTASAAAPVSDPEAADVSKSAQTEAAEAAAPPIDQERESGAARQKQEGAEEPEVAAADAVELDAEQTSASGKPPARVVEEKSQSGGDAPNPRVIVQRWQGGVSRAGAGLPKPNMSAVAGGPGKIAAAADKANVARRGKAKGAAEEAAAHITQTPKVPEPPPPPKSNPIPALTAAIEDASNKRLPWAVLPELSKSAQIEVVPGMTVGGNMPRIGDETVKDKWFQLLSREGAEAAAKIPEDPENPERKALEAARAALAKPIEVEESIAAGPPAPLIDQGPVGIAPLPPGKGTPVAKVVARLLASMDSATSDVLVRLRRIAYPKGVLQKEFPDIGSVLGATVGPRMNTELRDIAAAAGMSGAELDKLVAERKAELEKEAAEANKAIATSGEKAAEEVSQTGQEALDAIEGARQLTDEEIIKRQEAATGGSDPEVINARRDLVIRWVRTHVNGQTTNYQKAGEKREKDLNIAQYERVEAINSLAQREEYQGLHPATPHDRSKPEIARKLADFQSALRAAARDAVEKIRTAMRPLFTVARDTTREHRAAIEKAGNEAIDGARLWAEDRILEGQSWWERFKAKLSRWFGESQKSNEQWCVNRTEETRNGIAADLGTVEGVRQALAQGVTKEQLLQNASLTADQRAVVTEYFEQPAGAHPLDIAAGALRQRLAKQYLDVAKPVFEAELLAQPDGEELSKAAEVAHIARPTFNGPKIVQDVHAQLDNFDSDEAAMLRSLEGLSAFEGALVRRLYKAMFKIDMDFAMSQAFDSDELDQAQLRLKGQGAAADAAALDYAFGVINTDEKAIMDLLRGRSQEEIEQIRAEYRRRYGKDLDQALLDNLDKGNEQDEASALMKGDKEAAAAIEIDEAMRGGVFGWGTKQEDIEATYKRVHDEVLAQAQREGWSAELMQAETRRRLGRIEAQFEERYKDVEQYNEPGLEGKSTLRRAFSSEISPGPDRDLANALADNNMVEADAARIEIERRGVWASDEAINKVLANQYERSLEETRLDLAPARKLIIDRKRTELLKQQPPPTMNELSIEIMKLERELDQEASVEAQQRSNISMEALDDVYQKKYFYPLSYTIEANMSDVEREKARALHGQGGYLTPLQAVEYATEITGTDEETLRTRLGSMTDAEIAQLRRDWEAKHPGESFDDMLRGELSGRDESDIMDIVKHGAPKSAEERIAQEQRRVDRELGELTGVLGGAAAGNEAEWLRMQMSRLDELKADLHRRDLTDEERELLSDQLDYRVEIVQQGVEDHRRAIDSVANFAAQVASLVVAVAVGAALTFLSGGTLGPVMIAVIASVAATITTMGTKAMIQGGSYGAEDIGVDLAVGVVDALTAAATAGMGGKLLRGATGAAEQAAARVAQPNRLMRALGKIGSSDVMQTVAKSRAGQVAGKVASGLNNMESGFLTKGIKNANILSRMAQGDNKALRILAEGLAEGIENAVSALPSSFTGTALNDKTWEGNPLLNLAAGTYEGVKGSVQMGAAMHGARGAYGAVKSHIRLSTPEGRLTEANRILNAAREQHRAKNPDASYHEFLNSPEAKRAQAEIEQRGLVGEQRKLAQPDERAPSEPALAKSAATPEAAPRAAAETTKTLHEGLPKSLTDRVDVRVNEKLDGNAVHVIPDPRGPGHGVRVEVGPHATAVDVLLHAHTIQTMGRYQGLLGKLRQLKDWFNLTTVGTRGWEAKLELEKLPGIIHERMQRLSEGKLTAEAHQQLVAEINHLSRQIDTFQAVLDTPELRDAPGRGFVAMGAKKTGPEIEGMPFAGVERSVEGMRKAELTLIDDSPLNAEHQAVYQIGHRWQEEGRIYRRVVVHDAQDRIVGVHEEIALIDSANQPTGKWQKRGSDSSGKEGAGVVGEKASWRTVKEERFEGMVTKEGLPDTAGAREAAGRRRVQIAEEFLRNNSNNGFDGAFLRINHDGSATLVVVEAKNQPSGLTTESFTAVRGEQFEANLNRLRETLKGHSPKELGISAEDRALMLRTLNAEALNVEIQIHTTPGTSLGHREHPSSKIQSNIEDSVATLKSNKAAKPIEVVHVPMDETLTEEVRKEVQARDAIGQPAVRLRQLAGEGASESSAAYKRAKSMMLAEQAFTHGTVKLTPAGTFVDQSGVEFEVLLPGQRGRKPKPSTVAKQVIDRIRKAGDEGKLGKTRIVLDLGHLSEQHQREVLQLLRDDPRAVAAAQSILIHRRAERSMQVFDPKDVP